MCWSSTSSTKTKTDFHLEWPAKCRILKHPSDPGIWKTTHRAAVYSVFRQKQHTHEWLQSTAPVETCSSWTCGQSVRRATQMDPKESLPHWFPPLRHYTSWSFNGKKHLGTLDWWDPEGGEKAKTADYKTEKETWWGEEEGTPNWPYFKRLFESNYSPFLLHVSP